MKYADANHCPGCGADLDNTQVCRSCRLDLTSDAARRLWRLLTEADDLLIEAQQFRVPEVAPAPAQAPAPVQPVPVEPEPAEQLPPLPPPRLPPVQSPPPPQPAEARPPAPSGPRKPWLPKITTGGVLLGLGALALIVAASIFLFASWGSIGPLGRAAAFLVVTAVIGWVALIVTRRGLRGSAEALWTVFLGGVWLDWRAAESQGLVNFDGLPSATADSINAVLLVSAALFVQRVARKYIDSGKPELQSSESRAGQRSFAGLMSQGLVMPSLIAGAALATAVLAWHGFVQEFTPTNFWPAAAVAIGAAVATLLLRRLSLDVGAVVTLVVAVLSWFVASLFAFGQAADNPEVTRFLGDYQGLPLLLVTVSFGIAGYLLRRSLLGAMTFGIAGGYGALLLLALPIGHEWNLRGIVVLSAVLLFVAVGAGRAAAKTNFSWAVPVVAATPAIVLVSVVTVGAIALTATTGWSVVGFDTLDMTDRIDVHGDVVKPAWIVAVAGLGIGGAGLAVARLLRSRASHALVGTTAVVLAVTIMTTVTQLAPPVIVFAACYVSLGVALLALTRIVAARRTRAASMASDGSSPQSAAGNTFPLTLATAAAIVSSLVGLSAMRSAEASLVIWPASAAVLLLASVLIVPPNKPDRACWRELLVLAGAGWAVAAVLLAADRMGLSGLDLAWIGVAVTAILTLLAGRMFEVGSGRLGLETAAAMLAVVSLSLAAGHVPSASDAAIYIAALAGVALVLAYVIADRWWYVFVAASLGVLAAIVTGEQWQVALWVWPVLALLFAGSVPRIKQVEVRDVFAGCAAFTAAANTIPPSMLATDRAWYMPGALMVAVGLIALALAVFAVPRAFGAFGVEVGGGVAAVLGLAVIAGESTLSQLSFVLMVIGAAMALISLLAKQRNWYLWIAAACGALAYVLRLIASEVDLVEAYTLPFGLILLAAGLWVALKAKPEQRTWITLGPGLAACLLPSLPAALAHSTSARALLLGLAALAVMGAGAWRRWQAPFVLGACIAALVIFTNFGPLLWGLPRWTLIAATGVALVAVGVTWEQRVKDGRAAVNWVAKMR